MRKIRELGTKKWVVTLVWIIGIVIVWEIMAVIVAHTKRTPENILPHIYQILYSFISPKQVAGGQTVTQVVLFSTGATIGRAVIGSVLGYLIAVAAVQFPNSVPYIFTALKVSAPNSVISAIVAEYFAEYITGVGRAIRENIVIAQYSTAWAYILVACVIGIVFYAVLMIVESIVMKHRR